MSGSVSFKKRTKPSLRQREVETEVGTTETPASDAGGESPISLTTKLKKRGKPKSRLSFGVDETEGDGEVFQLKKSNLSRKLASSKQSSSNSIVAASSFDPPTLLPSGAGPTYSAAYLNELKASTPSSRPRVIQDESATYDADITMDTSTYAPQIVDLTMEDSFDDTAIPSGASITAAKEKRERLRTATANGSEDFISLSLTSRNDYSGGPHPDSRLVREEDELGEGDDEFAEYTSAQERIALGKKSRKVEAQKRRENMNELIADAEEEDEETMEWEQEQLRRGGLRTESSTASVSKPVYRPAPIPNPSTVPVLGLAVASLSRTIAMLTTSHTQHTTSMVSIGEERNQLETREKELRDMITSAEAKRSWFADFREWIESVATFLDEKYPLLEKLEGEQVSLIRERHDMVTQRRNAEDEDDLSLFLGTLPIPLRQQSEETDELGRLALRPNPAAARRDRISSRNARRQRRRESRPTKNYEEDGFSTDSSLPASDAADYVTAMQNLSEKRDAILGDVKAKDFLDPKLGLVKWFGEWRERFGETYTGAWGGLGMIAAWEFWARLEITGWDPLEDSRTLDTFEWYIALHDYSRPQQQEEEDEGLEPELGPDGDLVSSMITTAVIPRICKILEGGSLDPYSGQHVRRLIDLAEEIEISVTKEDLKFELILKSTFLVFQTALKRVEGLLPNYLALNHPRFDPEAIPARRRYLMRQYKLLHNLLRWRKHAGDKFGLGFLATSLVSDCIFPVAEGGWEVGGEDVMRKVITVLPSELVPVPVKVRMNLQ